MSRWMSDEEIEEMKKEAARQDAWDEGFKAGRARAEADLSARLMPEGYEWPRCEDGEPVKLGDMALIDGEADMVEAVQLWIHGKPVIYGDGGSQQLEKGERVKRPPVLAADGRPLREGEHVYHVETGVELVVKGLPKPGEYQAVVVFAPPASHLTSFDPDQLIHELPDSWERLDEDARKHRYDYWECRKVRCSSCPAVVDGKNPRKRYGVDDCQDAMQLDLVRRARALAERDGS